MAVTDGQPVTPPYFAFDARRNLQARPLLDEHDPPQELSLTELRVQQERGTVVLDAREPGEFAAGHLRGSLNVGLAGRFAEWAGAVIRPDQPVVLVCPPGRELEAKVRLARIGFDQVSGCLGDPLRVLLQHPEEVEHSSRLSAAELATLRAELADLGGWCLSRGGSPGRCGAAGE